MSKKINVTIKAKQVIEYYQQVEMNEEDFLVLKELAYDDVSETSEEYALLERYINPTDVFGNVGEYTDVEVFKTKSKNH
jgi:hypothetical protein